MRVNVLRIFKYDIKLVLLICVMIEVEVVIVYITLSLFSKNHIMQRI